MRKLATATALVAVASPALAHHPLNGAPMETFMHGILSGIGHPVLGFDHLFFVGLVGIAAVYTGRALAAPLAFIAAMLLGTLLMYSGLALPAVEPMIVASLLVLGFLVAKGRALSLPVALGLFAFAGLFHGSAYGGSIAGQEAGISMSVLAGYLIGLAGIQWAISVACGWAATRLWNATEASDIPARIAGATVAGIGAFLALETLEGAAFAALGLS